MKKGWRERQEDHEVYSLLLKGRRERETVALLSQVVARCTPDLLQAGVCRLRFPRANECVTSNGRRTPHQASMLMTLPLSPPASASLLTTSLRVSPKAARERVCMRCLRRSALNSAAIPPEINAAAGAAGRNDDGGGVAAQHQQQQEQQQVAAAHSLTRLSRKKIRFARQPRSWRTC